MKISKLSRLGALMMLIALISVPAALAQIPEYSTLPVTEPTEVGGTVLQPGSYLIRILPGFSNRNRVQITDTERQTVYATVLTVPHQLGPNEEMPNTMFVFYPAFEGQPRALRTWYAPDAASDGGHDIVYEETRATQLARAAKAPVVSYRGTIETADVTPELHVVTPEARVETYVPPTPRVAVVTPPATRTELPRTAGNTPMIALLGLFAIAGAFAFRSFVR